MTDDRFSLDPQASNLPPRMPMQGGYPMHQQPPQQQQPPLQQPGMAMPPMGAQVRGFNPMMTAATAGYHTAVSVVVRQVVCVSCGKVVVSSSFLNSKKVHQRAKSVTLWLVDLMQQCFFFGFFLGGGGGGGKCFQAQV